MTHVVCEPCINCKYTDCVAVCPVECFYEGNNMLAIRPEECIDCTNCVPECPAEAIFAEGDVPPEWDAFIALNERLAAGWPRITEPKKPMGRYDEGRSRVELLDERPFVG